MAFSIVGEMAVVAGDTSNSRPAAVFKGGNTDDLYQINATAVARTAANDTVGTIIAWINTGDNTSTSNILGFGASGAVEFIDFGIEAGKLASRCTDATVAQYAVATTNVVITPHKWTHVAMVQRADGYGPHMYVNGVEQPTTASITTDLNEWFINLDSIDQGTIGASRKSGDSSITNEFVGAISDLKYWNTAHTDAEIMDDYLGKVKASPICRWKFDGDLLNIGSDGTAATAVSDVYITPTYNEFISKLRTFGIANGTVTADMAGFWDNGSYGSCLIVNSS